MNLSLALRESTLTSQLFPKYFHLASMGLVYGVTYTAAAIAVASATATGAFALYNPPASGVALVILGATYPIITFTGATTGYGVGLQLVPGQQPTATTPGNTPQNRLVGSAGVSQAKTYVAGTLVAAPTAPAYISQGQFLAAGTITILATKEDLEGTLIIQPNSGMSVISTTAATATVAPSLFWAEIPLG